MARGRAGRRLAELAEQVGVERAPFYVRQPVPPGLQKTYPAEGWYWVPKGHNFAVFLGASYTAAVVELHRLIAEEEDAA